MILRKDSALFSNSRLLSQVCLGQEIPVSNNIVRHRNKSPTTRRLNKRNRQFLEFSELQI